jgi:threonine synthase
VLEELKRDRRTADLPVVVVSAMDLTESERIKLQGNIEALYHKGAFPPRKFVDQVVEVLEHKNIQSQKEEGKDAPKDPLY